MKIRLTILTENNAPRISAITEDYVKAAWELVLKMISTEDEKATVEKVEFVEEDE